MDVEHPERTGWSTAIGYVVVHDFVGRHAAAMIPVW